MASYESYMKIWSDSAKTCAQSATAAMFLPVFLIRELGVVDKNSPVIGGVNDFYIAAWLLWLLAIVMANVYQFTAATLIQRDSNPGPRLYPRGQFWVMVALLIGGFMACGLGGYDTFQKHRATAATLPAKSGS